MTKIINKCRDLVLIGANKLAVLVEIVHTATTNNKDKATDLALDLLPVKLAISKPNQ